MNNQWQPIETYKKDGTLVLLLVKQDFRHGGSNNPTEDELVYRTIGFNNFEHNELDEWQLAGWNWENDHFTEGHGEPIGWMPMPVDRELQTLLGSDRPKMTVKAEMVKGRDLRPGDLFSTFGSEYWDTALDSLSVGERAFIRTNTPADLYEDAGAMVYRLTVEPKPEE